MNDAKMRRRRWTKTHMLRVGVFLEPRAIHSTKGNTTCFYSRTALSARDKTVHFLET